MVGDEKIIQVSLEGSLNVIELLANVTYKNKCLDTAYRDAFKCQVDERTLGVSYYILLPYLKTMNGEIQYLLLFLKAQHCS